MEDRYTEADENFYIPVYQVFTKEIMLFGLPRSMAIFFIGVMAFTGLSMRNLVLTIVFFILYLVMVLVVKFVPKFDPKILETIGRFSFKKYINY